MIVIGIVWIAIFFFGGGETIVQDNCFVKAHPDGLKSRKFPNSWEALPGIYAYENCDKTFETHCQCHKHIVTG